MWGIWLMKIVPLLKISQSSSIYFDFDKEVPYIQTFRGYAIKARESSKNDTFWLTWLIIGGANLIGIVLDQLFKLPILFSIILALILGAIISKVFTKVCITNSLGDREYNVIPLEDIKNTILTINKIRLIWATYIFLIIGYILMSIILISGGSFKGKDFIMFILGSFAITFLHDIRPRLILKAIKILKKQMKEGKFDD